MRSVEFKYINLKKAYLRLKEVSDMYDGKNDIIRDSLIQRFEFTYELTHKTLKEFMKYLGVTLENSFPRIISIFCRAETLNQDGMVTDFSLIKKLIHEKLDHKNLNEILPFNPTAENIARWVCDQIPFCFRVEVQESEGNIAIYEKD